MTLLIIRPNPLVRPPQRLHARRTLGLIHAQPRRPLRLLRQPLKQSILIGTVLAETQSNLWPSGCKYHGP